MKLRYSVQVWGVSHEGFFTSYFRKEFRYLFVAQFVAPVLAFVFRRICRKRPPLYGICYRINAVER